MERPTQLSSDENTSFQPNAFSVPQESHGPVDARQIPRVVIESTGQSRFASSVVKVLSLQRFYRKTARRSRDSWLERYTYHTTEDERDWRRPLMRRSASNSPQALSPSSEATGTLREESDACLADMTERRRCAMTLVFDPSGDAYLFWLLLVGLGIVYNWWTVIFRVAFFVREQKYVVPFMAVDFSFDFIFFLDIVVQFRTGYFLDGKIVTDAKQLAKRYVKSLGFFLDCVSILPTDLLFLVLGPRPALRFGRLLKSHRLFLFYDRVEIYSGRPKLFNLLKQVHYLFLIIHWVACLYFFISYLEGFGVDKWVHPALKEQWAEVGPQYLYSLFRSLVSMTTVGTGKQVSPQTTMSYLFCIFTYLCGVLIFATIVGNTADVIVELRRHREKYHRKLDGMKEYITAKQLPMDLQRRVIQWFDYTWRYKKDMSEEELFERLNDNFKAEIAIHVNLDTLKKVKMFEHCEPGFLRELVLKLQHVLCSPGDYVCRQDEIGREMYIVNKGGLEVVDNNENVLATLSAGRHFGEISILNMKGIGNRRTASVRSVGFSDLFRLSKSDLEEVLEYYPEVREQLERIARQTYEKQRRERLNQSADNESRCNAQDSALEEHDPRRWLVADKETLQRRLSHIEAKNDVRFLANKFRRENGNSVNPRDIVAAMAQRVRKERSDEASRQIIKDFLAQSRGKKMSKGNAVSHESLIANKKPSSLTNLANGANDVSVPERTSSNEHLKKSQRRFFNRPRSRTQDSRPSSLLGNEIPLLTFNEFAANEICREKQSGKKDTPLILSSVHKLSGVGKIGGSPVVKKGILKRSSAEVIPPPKWLLSDLRAFSSSHDNLPSDDENAKQSKSPSDKVWREGQKRRRNSSDDEGKLNDVKVVLATPESSDIEDDSLEICPKTKVHYSEKKTGGEIPYKALLINNLERQQLEWPTKITSPSAGTFTKSPATGRDQGGVECENTSPPVITVQEPQDPDELFNTIQ